MVQFYFDEVENIVEKGEHAGYHNFLLSYTMFSNGFFSRVVKTLDWVVKNWGYLLKYRTIFL